MNGKALGLFDWMDSGDTSTADREVGLRVLRAYYDMASTFSGFSFQSFEDFLAWAEQATSLATDIGELIRNTSYTNSESSAVSRVRDLANKSGGTAAQGNIIQAAGGSGNTINWSVAIPVVGSDIAQGIYDEASGLAQNVGTGVLGTLNLVKYLPWILLAGGAIWLYSSGTSFKKLIRK